MLRIAIITCSDTRTATTDSAGPALAAECARLGWQVIAAELCPDDANSIAGAIARLADEMGADIVLTTGGTGFGPRDVTPEATRIACDRDALGIAEWIRAKSMGVTRRAMLSRGTAGLRGHTLVVNLPGSHQGALEGFGFVFDQFDHAVQMMHGGGHEHVAPPQPTMPMPVTPSQPAAPAAPAVPRFTVPEVTPAEPSAPEPSTPGTAPPGTTTPDSPSSE